MAFGRRRNGAESGTERGDSVMATPEERIAALEARMNGTDAWLKDMDSKLDSLVAAANMGRGAWWIILRIGGVLVVLGGALAWLIDKVWK